MACNSDFSRLDEPHKEFLYESQGRRPKATGVAWLPTDTNLAAVAYDNGHVALFDVRSGVLSNALEVSDTAVLAVASHELKPLVATGHEGKVVLTDFKTNATVATIEVPT